jgi:thiosulfate/3-mercaptopyruvate sulfurtransferase
MMLPVVVAPEELAASLGAADLLVVDLCKPEIYAAGHVPGAVHLDFAPLVATRGKAEGMVPEMVQLAHSLSALGLAREHHVVAYDDSGGGKAGRLLWTLDLLEHPGGGSLLDGGIGAWSAAGHPLESGAVSAKASDYPAALSGQVSADKDYLLGHLEDPDVVLLDARTPEEYSGSRVRAARGGHIPGAVNFNWLDAMDADRHHRLKPAEELRSMLEGLGITPDKEVITYCQTHHRSSHTYVVLKSLGYERIKGYPGSWSEWGNLADVPIEA